MDKNRPSAQSEGQLLDFWQQEGPTSFLKVLQEKEKKKKVAYSELRSRMTLTSLHHWKP